MVPPRPGPLYDFPKDMLCDLMPIGTVVARFRRMQTIGIVLNVREEQVDEFERGFREMEAPIWADLHSRGVLTMATLTRLDISTQKVDGARQYLVVAIFASDEGHHLHDQDPRFEAWNKRADAYQISEPLVFGGDTIISVDV
jgi:hypothetical protein